jgi:Flp pilus assembly protein TadD
MIGDMLPSENEFVTADARENWPAGQTGTAGAPVAWEAEYRAAIKAREAGNYDEASRSRLRLVTENPTVPMLHWQLGYTLLDAGAPEQSIAQFESAISLAPECIASWGGLGHAYAAMEQWDMAEHAFRTRLSIKESPSHYIFLCDVLHQKGDYLGALRCCERAIELRPSDGEAYLFLGITYVQLRVYDETAEAFENAIQLDPNDPRAIRELGFLRFGQGNFGAAEKLLRKALTCREPIASDPLDRVKGLARSRLYLALTLERQRRLVEARREFLTAIELDGDDPDIVREYRRFRRRMRGRGRGWS